MAPRRKTCKRKNAAVKGLEPFGFPRNTILKTVNSLLKTYGGENGWTFIEEDSYKLVIERILEDQEEREEAVKEEDAEVETGDSTVCDQTANNANDNVRSGASEPTIPTIHKRRPCYGWISETEDESDDPPANVETGV